MMLMCIVFLCSYMPERRMREAQLRTHINQKLDEAGTRER